MRKLVLFLLIYNSIFECCFGQNGWFYQSQNEPLRAVYAVDKDTIFVVGDYRILKSINEGANFYNVTPERVLYRSIYFTNRSLGWVASWDGIYHTIDGGENWGKVHSATRLETIFFVSDSIGLAGAGFWRGRILKTTDQGRSWVTQNLDMPIDIDRFYFLNENIGWFFGQHLFRSSNSSLGIIGRTTNGGIDWQTEIPVPSVLRVSHFRDELNGIAIYGGGNIFYSVDGGESWQSSAHNLPFIDNIDNGFFVNDSTGWIVGENGLIAKTPDFGKTWIKQESGTGSDLNSVHFTDLETGFVLSTGATILNNFSTGNSLILKTSNGGTSWTRLLGKISFENLRDVHFVNDSTGYIVGQCGTLFKTVNGGHEWTRLDSPTSATFHSVFFTSPDSGWVVGEAGRIIKTNNGGGQWLLQSSPTEVGLRSVCFSSPTHGIIVGAKGTILRTTDAGMNWQSVDTGLWQDLFSVYLLNSNVGYAVGYGKTIIKTLDGGKTWFFPHSGTGDYLQDVFFINDRVGWAVGAIGFNDKGSILKSVDGGKTWSKIVSKDLPVFRGVHFITEKEGWVVGGGFNGSILKTRDGGQSWYQQFYGGSHELNSLFFINDSVGWSVGNEGVVLKTDMGGGHFIRRADFDIVDQPSSGSPDTTKSNRLANFPNPANQTVFILYQLNSQSDVEFGLFNVRGQQILKSFYSQQDVGEHQINLSVSKIPAGVYIYQIRTRNFEMVEKLVIIH